MPPIFSSPIRAPDAYSPIVIRPTSVSDSTCPSGVPSGRVTSKRGLVADCARRARAMWKYGAPEASISS
ncbi:hypothetical protein GCM10009675_20650 [Prauserella alba]|uniref:Uncharacterized protein n=1 Tax=Prauserella alba TaxID=176898 RepID=A0ABN1VB38_9PSEU